MKILVLNGNPNPKRDMFEQYLDDLNAELTTLGHEPQRIDLKSRTIAHCIGCYSCWLKNPGVCINDDDMPSILRAFLKSDIVVYASPLLMGFMSSLLKTAQERMLPLMHPYLFVKDDRCQHIPRYGKYPAIVTLLEKQHPDEGPCIEIMDQVIRGARTRKVIFTRSTDTSAKELAHEIDHI